MRTPKIAALDRLITFFHLYHPLLHVDNLKPLDTSPLDSNAWLSGMWDADGGFLITISKNDSRTVGYRVKISAKMELAREYKYDTNNILSSASNYSILRTIADYFKIRTVQETSHTKNGKVYPAYSNI